MAVMVNFDEENCRCYTDVIYTKQSYSSRSIPKNTYAILK